MHGDLVTSWESNIEYLDYKSSRKSLSHERKQNKVPKQVTLIVLIPEIG